MDYITIDRLKVFCNHGVYEDEKKTGQNFYVSARIYLDTYRAGNSDNLNLSVNYAALCHDITEYMQKNRFDLIEAVANNLAAYILSYNPLIRGLKLRIHKPEAPVGLPFDDISVTIERFWTTAYIAYGSNLGDSRAIIADAIDKISDNPAIRLTKKSSTIITKPYGNITDQPDFHNGCIEIETYLSPEALLDYLHSIENAAGRTREIHWGPRTLDLDIILYGDMIINTESLTVPHIDMQNRIFVLKPLCEIAPYAYHPVLKKTVNSLLSALTNEL